MRTIKVKGEGSVKTAPDSASISFNISAKDKIYSQAIAEANKVLSALKQAIVSVGFLEQDLKTSNFSVRTCYDSVRQPDNSYKNVFSGYQASHSVGIVFALDKELLAKVLGALSSCVGAEFSISFFVRDEEAIKERVLEAAAKNARARAEVLAAASGQRLGELVSIDYSCANVNIMSATFAKHQARAMSDVALEFVPEDVNSADYVHFVWELI